MKPTYEELESRCAELAAENTGLKSSVAEVRRQAFNARRNSHNCGPFSIQIYAIQSLTKPRLKPRPPTLSWLKCGPPQ